MQPDKLVYVVNPDEAVAEALTVLLGTYDIQVRTFLDAESFLEACAESDFTGSCLLVDADLPNLSGISLLQKVRAQGCHLPVIVLTNPGNQEIRQRAILYGATDILEKPLISGFLIKRLAAWLPGVSNA